MIRSKQILLIFLPALLIVSLGWWLQVRRYQPLYSNEPAPSASPEALTIPIFPEDPIIGNPRATTAIINFADFGCNHCREEMAMLNDIVKQYPNKIKIIWKSLPVTRIPYRSDLAHDYAYCANLQGKFAAFAAQAFAHNELLNAARLDALAAASTLDKSKLSSCLASGEPVAYRQKTAALASALNIQAVPAVFINNKQVEAPKSLEGWKVLLGIAM